MSSYSSFEYKHTNVNFIHETYILFDKLLLKIYEVRFFLKVKIRLRLMDRGLPVHIM